MAAQGELAFLGDLTLVVVVAAVTTLVFYRLRQPVVVGYLLAGILVGPFTPGATVGSVERVREVAELGVIFLMFAVGLEFRLSRLVGAGLPAVGAALLQIGLVVALTYAVGGFFGWSQGDALFMGAILAISSTVIAAKVITERGEQGEPWAELALAILIVEDVVAVALLALLGTGGANAFGPAELLGVLGRLTTFALAALVLGLLLVPRLVNFLVLREAHEVLVVTLAGLALGVAFLALSLGFSPALGAFLIGAVVAEASEAWRAEEHVLPLRDLFSAVFFVSIGMLLDPRLLLTYWQPIVVLALLLLVFRVALYSVPATLLGAPPRAAFRASLALGHIGEFSFILAGLGLALGVVSGFVLPVTVAVALLSALWTPYLVRASDPAYERVVGWLPPRWKEAWARQREAGRLRRLRRTERLSPEQRRLAGRALLNALAAALVLYATGAAAEAVEQFVAVRGLSDRALALLPWIGGGVLALPFAFHGVRLTWALLASGRAAPTTPPHLQESKARVRGAALVGAVLVLAVLLALAPTLPPLPLLLLGVAAFLGAALALGSVMARLQTQVEKALEDALGGAPQGETRLAVLDALQGEYRWGLHADRFRVRPGSRAAASTLQLLDVRARTGATVVAARRGARTVVNPPPHFVVEPGDHLVLLGEQGQLERARRYLGERAPEAAEEGGRVAELRVVEGGPLEGRTLGESGLRDAGATVLGILREGRLLAAGRDVRLAAGDTLLVVGSEEGVRAAGALAGGPGGSDLSPAGAASPRRTPGP